MSRLANHFQIGMKYVLQINVLTPSGKQLTRDDVLIVFMI